MNLSIGLLPTLKSSSATLMPQHAQTISNLIKVLALEKYRRPVVDRMFIVCEIEFGCVYRNSTFNQGV